MIKFVEPNCPAPDAHLTLGEHVEAMAQAGFFEDGVKDFAAVLRILCDNLPEMAQRDMAMALWLREAPEERE